MASVNAAIEILRLAMLHGRGRRRGGGRGGSGGAVEAESALAQAYDDMDGRRVMALYHPAALLRDPGKRPETFDDLKKLQAEIRLRCTHTY